MLKCIGTYWRLMTLTDDVMNVKTKFTKWLQQQQKTSENKKCSCYENLTWARLLRLHIKLKRILASRYSNLNWTQKLCTIKLWSYVTKKKNQIGETYFFEYEMLCINILYSCLRNQFYKIGLAHKILLGFYVFLKLWKSAVLCYVMYIRKKPISNLKIYSTFFG